MQDTWKSRNKIRHELRKLRPLSLACGPFEKIQLVGDTSLLLASQEGPLHT
jgi:hypothetical protein